MEIDGKVALVTGAASGIGRASALALAGAGAAVVVVDVDAAGGERTAGLVRERGGRAICVRADVATPDGIRAMFEAAAEAFGGVDIVHNNAGIVGGDTPGWPDTTLERLHDLVSINVAGAIMGTRAAIDALSQRGGGAIVNTASIAALGPMPNDPAYAASKAAIVLFTKSCAPLKQSHNIRVNAVLPGMVDTPIIAKTGDGTTPAAWLAPALAAMNLLAPEEIAAAVLDLIRDDTLSGEARVVNGTAK